MATILKPRIKLTPEFEPLFLPNHPHYKTRFLSFDGGRAGMKSWQVARGILCRMMKSKIRVLCTREYQSSISDSVIHLLESQAYELKINKFFKFQNNTILGLNGSEVIFKGLKLKPQEVKSTEAIDLCWVEEAQSVSERSWLNLVPTIRKPGSQIIVTFNPGQETDPTYKRFITDAVGDKRIYRKRVTYLDNPWVSKDIIEDAEKLKQKDYEGYRHIYLGEPWTRSDSQVLNGCWRVGEMDTEGAYGAYFGADFGFSSDPSTLIKSWIIPKGKRNVLYIEKECYEHGVEIDDYEEFYKRIPESEKHEIRADNARPELISHIRKKGFRISAAQKWGGSVEDGISYLRNFDEIVINPSCTYTIQEAREWKYKTDKLTEDVLPVLIDAHNHCWDAVRYALQPLIKPLKEPQMRTT